MRRRPPQSAVELLDRLAGALEPDNDGNIHLPTELPLRQQAAFILERAENMIVNTLHGEVTAVWLVHVADQLASDAEHFIAAQALPDVPSLTELESMPMSEVRAAARHTAEIALTSEIPLSVGQLADVYGLTDREAAVVIGEAARKPKS